MAMIDGVFCLDLRAIYKRETLSVVMLDGLSAVGLLDLSAAEG